MTEFTALGAITSSGDAAGFPVGNVADLDPGLVWRASAYIADVWLRCDMGTPRALGAVFINRANVPQARIQGHDTDIWTAPAFNQLVTLARDEAGNRKGFFVLSGFNFRWLRVLIPVGQTLDFGTVPEIGNLIVGAVASLPAVRDYRAVLTVQTQTWLSDGGSLRKRHRGRRRHVLTLDMASDLSAIRGVGKTWAHGVLFADLGSAADAWLVYGPQDHDMQVRSLVDAGLRVQLEERV